MELMGPKMLAETADMIGVKELRDAFKEVYTHTHTYLTALGLLTINLQPGICTFLLVISYFFTYYFTHFSLTPTVMGRSASLS